MRKTVELCRYFFFSFENAKNLGRLDDSKRRKKGDGLISLQYFGLFEHLIYSLTQDLERLLTVC